MIENRVFMRETCFYLPLGHARSLATHDPYCLVSAYNARLVSRLIGRHKTMATRMSSPYLKALYASRPVLGAFA